MSIDALRAARKALTEKGVAPNETLGNDYIEFIMDIKRRKNAAVLAAIAEAEKPFNDELREAQEEYAVFLQLAS